MNDPVRPLIVHHANCPDGFGAAWWLARNLPEGWEPAELFAATYGPTDPDVDPVISAADFVDRPVFIVDFCWPARILDQIAVVAERVVVLDHHATAVDMAAESDLLHYSSLDEWEKDGPSDTFVAVIDQNRSGIGLVGDWVGRTSGVRPPDFVYNLEDRDLWRFEFGDTPDVFAAVTSWPYELEVWDHLAELPHVELVAQGKAINRYRDRLVDQVAAASFNLDLDGMVIPCASSPYAIGSDVAGRLAEQSDGIGAYVILHEGDVQVGLRSRNDGPDVAAIAQRFGGGGHVHSSGLRLSWEDFGKAAGI